MSKQARQFTIKEIIRRKQIQSQEELLQLLKVEGLEATQATLSRDLAEMGVIRQNTSDGIRYELPETPTETSRLQILLSYEVTSIQANESLVVIKTLPGRAQGVAELVDALKHPNILATIAGDNTIFVAPTSAKHTKQITKELRDFIALTEGGRE